MDQLVEAHGNVMGLVTGNDETAAAFLDAILPCGHKGVVMGCDGTREMRQLARIGRTVIETVLTHARDQAQEVVRACSKRLVGERRFRQPSLMKRGFEARQIIQSHQTLRSWWPDLATSWLDRPSGRA